jgi:hypothetical protein
VPHRLRVFEKRLLRRIFGLKRDESDRGCRKLHEELHNLYCPPNVSVIKSKTKWAGRVARVGK